MSFKIGEVVRHVKTDGVGQIIALYYDDRIHFAKLEFLDGEVHRWYVSNLVHVSKTESIKYKLSKLKSAKMFKKYQNYFFLIMVLITVDYFFLGGVYGDKLKNLVRKLADKIMELFENLFNNLLSKPKKE